jgi:AraC-like DNA-binding protein
VVGAGSSERVGSIERSLDGEAVPPAQKRPDRCRGGLAGGALLRVHAYIDAHVGERISLDQLAALAGVSKSHFVRQFRHSAGQSPMSYLRRIRIERSKTFLQTRAITIAQVAAGLGFSDQSHFTRVFGRMVGVPPGAYARSSSSDAKRARAIGLDRDPPGERARRFQDAPYRSS